VSEEKKVRLYEFSAMVSYGVVVAAISEEDAKKHIEDWGRTWCHQEFQSVSDVDLFEVRDVDQTPEVISGRANEVTIESQLFLHLSEPRKETE